MTGGGQGIVHAKVTTHPPEAAQLAARIEEAVTKLELKPFLVLPLDSNPIRDKIEVSPRCSMRGTVA
jgi:hypothetical protein